MSPGWPTLRTGAFSTLAAGLLALFACSRHEAPPPPAETPAPPPVASPSSAATFPSPSASSAPRGSTALPTEEDFEDESASKITPDTLDAQLDALEREIQAE